MKKIILIIPLLLLFSCETSFSGYIVYKEYIQGHFCHDENYKVVTEANVSNYIHVPIHNVHHHTWQESEFNIYVANKDAVRCFSVDSITFVHYKLLEKVQIKL